jgi:hypothetical protein
MKMELNVGRRMCKNENITKGEFYGRVEKSILQGKGM